MTIIANNFSGVSESLFLTPQAPLRQPHRCPSHTPAPGPPENTLINLEYNG